jgi:hypothetical protein
VDRFLNKNRGKTSKPLQPVGDPDKDLSRKELQPTFPPLNQLLSHTHTYTRTVRSAIFPPRTKNGPKAHQPSRRRRTTDKPQEPKVPLADNLFCSQPQPQPNIPFSSIYVPARVSKDRTSSTTYTPPTLTSHTHHNHLASRKRPPPNTQKRNHSSSDHPLGIRRTLGGTLAVGSFDTTPSGFGVSEHTREKKTPPSSEPPRTLKKGFVKVPTPPLLQRGPPNPAFRSGFPTAPGGCKNPPFHRLSFSLSRHSY